MRKISLLLEKIKNIKSENRISLGEIINMNSNSSYFIIFIFTIISFIPAPIPIPIISIIAGLINIILIYQLIFYKNKRLNLPKFLANLKIKNQTLINVIIKLLPVLKNIELKTKNRFYYILGRKMERIYKIFLLLLSICLLLPIPFFSIIPAFAILLIIFGLLNKDGLFAFVGCLFGAVSILLTIVLFIFGRNIIIKIF